MSVLLGCAECALAAEYFQPQQSRRHDPVATKTNYHGWTKSWVLDNGLVEAVIVPEIGRVMQFRFVGEEGVFWEDAALQGKPAQPKSKEWINFGGDKAWPSPQADWPSIAGRGWPPPPAFDAMAVKARVDGAVVTLTSPVDPHYGIRVQRRIELEGREPVLRITTRYDKVRGKPVRTGVWVVTQLRHPIRTYSPVRKSGPWPEGFNLQSDKRPPSLRIDGDLLALERDTKSSFKIGTDANALIWVGDRYVLKIESPRLAGRDYPDNGSSAEIYTNPDPKAYVELELLGPLETLQRGQSIGHTNRYHLRRRSPATPDEEARKALELLNR